MTSPAPDRRLGGGYRPGCACRALTAHERHFDGRFRLVCFSGTRRRPIAPPCVESRSPLERRRFSRSFFWVRSCLAAALQVRLPPPSLMAMPNHL